MDDILRTAPPGMSRFARLKTLLWLRWRSLRMAWAKKGRDVIGDGIGGYARVVKGTDDEAPHAQGERGMNMPMRALPPSKRETK